MSGATQPLSDARNPLSHGVLSRGFPPRAVPSLRGVSEIVVSGGMSMPAALQLGGVREEHCDVEERHI